VKNKSNESDLLGAATFLTATHFLIHVYSQFLPAVLPMLREEMGLSLTEAGLLVSLPLTVQTLIYLLAGVASDRAPGTMLAAAFASTAVGALAVAYTGGYPGLILGFTLIALGSTLYHPPALKTTSEVDPKRRSLVMGVQNAGGSLGYAAGPIVLGVLMALMGWRAAMLLWLPLILGAAVYGYIYGRRGHDSAQQTRRVGWRAILSGELVAVIIIGVFTDAAFVVLTTYLTTYFTQGLGCPTATSSLVFGLGAAVGVLGSLSGGVVGERLGRGRVYAGLAVLMGAAALLIPATCDLRVAAALYVCWRMFYSTTMPLTNLYVADSSPGDARSTAFGVYSVASNLLSAAVPVAGSAAIEALGVSAIFPLSAALLAPCLLGLVWLTRREAGKPLTANDATSIPCPRTRR
jgi:MFS transporter, FSR family, fosmidomycin resistance protein